MMLKESERIFDIRNKSHRLISAYYGQLQWGVRNQKRFPGEREAAAKRLAEVLQTTPQGKRVLKTVEQDAKEAREKYMREAAEYRLTHPQIETSRLEAVPTAAS